MKKNIRFICIISLFVAAAGFLKAQPWMQAPYMNSDKSNANFYDVKNAFNEWSQDKNLKKTKGIKPYKRWEWFWESRVYPTGQAPDPSISWYESMKFRKNADEKSTQSTMWVSLSPNNIPITRDSMDIIGMGRINCIAFHPLDTSILFVGASQGGVWKSVDGGNSWMNLTDNLPLIRISHIAVHPQNPNIMYIATGDIDDVAFNPANEGRPYCWGIGVMKTTNGGASWDTTGLSFELAANHNSLLRKIIINPNNPEQIIVGGYSGVWRSNDAGLTWEQKSNICVIDMEENPLNANVIYASTFYKSTMPNSKRIYKTYDFGENWAELITGMPTGSKIARVELALSKADTNFVYAISCKQDGGMEGLYKSINAGQTWTKLNNASNTSSIPNVLGWADGGKLSNYGVPLMDTVGQGWYDLTLAVDPLNANKVYAGGVNMWGSINGGSAWNIVALWVGYFGKSIHADQHYSIYHPVTNAFYQANDGGLYKTYNIQIGSLEQIALPPPFGLGCMTYIPGCYELPTKWVNLGHGIHNTEFYKLGLCRSNANMIVGGSQDNGTFLYKDGTWVGTFGGDGMEAMIAHDNDDVIYVTNYNGSLSRSDDGGLTYISSLDTMITSVANEDGDWVTPYVMHPTSSDTIYGAFQNVWMSPDKGTTWTKLGDNYSSVPFIAMAIAPSNADYIYASRGQTVCKTTDGGQNWININSNLPLFTVMNTYLAVDATNPQNIWATFSGYVDTLKVFSSTDGGTTWKNISYGLPNVPVNTVAHNKTRPGEIYVGTDIGVYITNDSLQLKTDTSARWKEYNYGLPNVIVNELEIHEGSQKLRAATYGRGMWEVDLWIPNSVKSNLANSSDFSVFPNPNNGVFTVEAKSESFKNIELTVYSVIGNKVLHIKESGDINWKKVIDLRQFEKGVYFIQVKTHNSYYTTRVVVQ